MNYADADADADISASANANANANEIIPNLWLGDIKSSTDINFIKQKNINCVFNCTISGVFIPSIRYKYRVPVKDNCLPEEIYLMYSILDKTVTLISSHLAKDDIILVHCHAGRQRSVAIILAFIMKHTNLSLNNALAILKTKRPIAGHPQFNFYDALKKYEEKLGGGAGSYN